MGSVVMGEEAEAETGGEGVSEREGRREGDGVQKKDMNVCLGNILFTSLSNASNNPENFIEASASVLMRNHPRILHGYLPPHRLPALFIK